MDDKDNALSKLIFSLVLASGYGLAKNHAKLVTRDNGVTEIDWSGAEEVLKTEVNKLLQAVDKDSEPASKPEGFYS